MCEVTWVFSVHACIRMCGEMLIECVFHAAACVCVSIINGAARNSHHTRFNVFKCVTSSACFHQHNLKNLPNGIYELCANAFF